MLAGPVLALPMGWIFLRAETLWVVYAANFMFQVFSPMWIGGAAGTVNDMVMPRMRAMASRLLHHDGYLHWPGAGAVSDRSVERQHREHRRGPGDALRGGMEAGLMMLVVSTVFLIPALRFLPREEANRLERARAAGEKV